MYIDASKLLILKQINVVILLYINKIFTFHISFLFIWSLVRFQWNIEYIIMYIEIKYYIDYSKNWTLIPNRSVNRYQLGYINKNKGSNVKCIDVPFKVCEIQSKHLFCKKLLRYKKFFNTNNVYSYSFMIRFKVFFS